MAAPTISTNGLGKFYGKNRGLDGLDLDVLPGEVFGFLGPNGAGKTTTIRLLLDLIRPTSGHAEVLGMDPRVEGVALRRRVGFLAGEFIVNGAQTGRELLTYLANLRGGVPSGRIEALADRLDVDLDRWIRSLSRGNRQKVGVVQAFMHDPELLILDEPTSGLDPFLQQEFAAMVRDVRSEGRTVFMSSHVMSEVQQVADRVGIIRDGRLVATEDIEDLRSRAMRRVEVTFDEPIPAARFDQIDGVTEVEVDGPVLRCRLAGSADALIKAVADHAVVTLSAVEPDLEELFFHYYDRNGRDVS